MRVMFELTYRCNFHCKHCYVPFSYRKYGELKTKEVYSILDQLAEIGCFYLGLTGGEPFMRKDILKIIAYAKNKGFQIILYTNGSLIDKAVARELGRLRLNKVDITIPGMSQKAFEAVSEVPGSRDRVFKAIDFLRQNRVALGFKTCVLKDNQEEINQIQDFAASLGSLHRLDDRLSRKLDGSPEPYEFRGSLKEKTGILHKRRFNNDKDYILKKNCDYDIVELKTNNLFKCGVGLSQAAITPQGELKPCLMIEEPKYKIKVIRQSETEEKRLSLLMAWDKIKGFVSSLAPDSDYKCATCDLRVYCKWCPAKGWLSSGSLLMPDSECYQAAGVLKKRTINEGERVVVHG